MSEDLVDVTGKECLLCLYDFDHGERVVFLTCEPGGNHLICGECCEGIKDFSVCPLCDDGEVEVASYAIGQIYRKGSGSGSDAIIID